MLVRVTIKITYQIKRDVLIVRCDFEFIDEVKSVYGIAR